MGDYGLVYILTHGSMLSIYTPTLYNLTEMGSNDPNFCDEMESFRRRFPRKYDPNTNPNGLWKQELLPLSAENLKILNLKPPDDGLRAMLDVTCLLRTFFKNQNDTTASNFEGSVIYINACHSAGLNQTVPADDPNPIFKGTKPAFSTATLFLGNNTYLATGWGKCMAYYLFHYMMCGNIIPEQVPGFTLPSPFPIHDRPMHVTEAVDTLINYGVNPNPVAGTYHGESYCSLLTYSPGDSTEKIYFPGNVTVTVHKNEKNIK